MSKYFLVLVFLFCVSLAVAAESCAPNVTLINQDPYPAVPGNYVKLVFQISSISSSDCGDINFALLPKYPLILDPRETGIRTFSKVDYLKDYNTNILVPYKVRVDENAVDGSSPIEINLQNKGTSPLAISKTFNLEIKTQKQLLTFSSRISITARIR